MYSDEPGLENARQNLKMAKEQFEQAQKNYTDAEGEVLRKTIEQVRREFPQIERVGIRSYWEYDDEGSYYWSVGVQVEPDEGSDVWSEQEVKSKYSDRTYTQSEYYTITDDLLEGFSADAWAALCCPKYGLENGGEYWVGEENE